MQSLPGEPFYNYAAMSSYPGMSVEDTATWNQFIVQYPNFCRHVHYNVRVGKGAYYSPNTPPNYQKMISDLSMLRIDAITIHSDIIRVIEVKPRGTTTAVGQLITYDQLLREKFAQLPPTQKTLVCITCPQDIVSTLHSNGIELYQLSS